MNVNVLASFGPKKAEQETKEKARIAAEAQKKKQQEEIKRRDEEEAKLIESQKKYKAFLKKHNYNSSTQDNFYLLRVGNKITLFKKIDEITI